MDSATSPRAVSDADLSAYCAMLAQQRAAERERYGYRAENVRFEADRLKRFARIARREYDADTGTSRNGCALAFIDLTNGDIYKVASWKAPLSASRRGKRGNLFALLAKRSATAPNLSPEILDGIRHGNQKTVVSKAYGRPGQVTVVDLCDAIEKLMHENAMLRSEASGENSTPWRLCSNAGESQDVAF